MNLNLLKRLPIDTIIDELKYVLVKREDKKTSMLKIMKKHPDDYATYFVYQENNRLYRKLDKQVETLTNEIKRRLKYD